MPILIAMLRGINVGGHHIIKMEALRSLFTSLKFENPQTYVQSGNVIFQSPERNLKTVAARVQSAIEKKFACSPEIIIRTVADLRTVVANNPFAKRKDVLPNYLHVSFLAASPAADAVDAIRALNISPEELHLVGRDLYMYFPNGIGKSKLPWVRLDKALATRGTARNWNSVTKMLAMAEALEKS
jgi:uncharacterized protein (DUF1697 family)